MNNQLKNDHDSMDVIIRDITAEDVPGFRQALDVVAREGRFLTFLEAPPLDQTRSFVLGGLAKGDPRVVAIAAGNVVGWCDIGRHPFPTHAHRGSLGMGIVPSHRGRGLGTRLIDAALSEAWRRSFTRVELSVYADNGRAIHLYEKIGFLREGTVRNAVCVDGRYRDAIMMAILHDEGQTTA